MNSTARTWTPNPHAIAYAKKRDKQEGRLNVTLETKATQLVQMHDATTASASKSGFTDWILNPILLVSVFISFLYACWKTFLYVMECNNCKIAWFN